MSNFCVHFLAICLVGSAFGFSDLLKAEFATAKLPKAMKYSQPVYDGNDSIYLFGGYANSELFTEILRYNIITDSIEEVGQLPVGSVQGSVQRVEMSGDVYYFYLGGSNETVNITIFEPATGAVLTVGNFPGETANHLTTFKQENSSVIYALLPTSGAYSNLYKLDTSTGEISTVTEPMEFRGLSSVIVDNYSYNFGFNLSSKVLKIDLNTLATSIIYDVPDFSYYSFAASDGMNAYLIGGYDPQTSKMGDYLLKLNSATQDWTQVEVENFPYKGDEGYNYIAGPSTIYVNKLNRIYYFGGEVTNLTMGWGGNYYSDDIWYIDLSTTEPPTSTPFNPSFSCMGKPDGFYPNPTDCSKFVWCKEGHSTELECPSPLLFDPITSRCDNPDYVSCEAGCIGKLDGQYPHPTNCSLFVLCDEEVLSVYQCPEPLLFDPVIFICNDPESVNCF